MSREMDAQHDAWRSSWYSAAIPMLRVATSRTGHPLEDKDADQPPRLPVADAVSDERLVDRAKNGDRWAEEAIYRRYVQYVGGIATRLLRDRADADDVVQDTFVTAFEQLLSLREGAALRVWLARIAVSHMRKKFRRKRLLSWVGLDTSSESVTWEECADEKAGPEVLAELAMLDIALSMVPSEERIPWVLHHVQGESLPDVSEACGCSLATVKRRIAAAEMHVKRHIHPKELES